MKNFLFMLMMLSFHLLKASPPSRGTIVQDEPKVRAITTPVYTTNRDFVVEKIYLDPTSISLSARSVTNIAYLDGFGRKQQVIQVDGSPGKTGDIVLPYQYGVQGRVEKEYLPYALTDNLGRYVPDAFNSDRWKAHGMTESRYTHTLTEYDNSPLDRVVKQTGPGRYWHEKKKGVTTVYGTNDTNRVRLYRVGNNGSLTLSGYYAAGTLQKVIITDEDGKQVETFTDNTGKTVLTSNLESNNSRLETYQVYDARGLLCYVLSPEASLQLGSATDETILQRYSYRYDYDARGRMIRKRLPGCDPIYLVYDKRDRLVMSQDGRQRAQNANKWSYSLYDHLNRVVESGEVSSSVATHAALQTAATASENYIPTGVKNPLIYAVYDTYLPTSDVTPLSFVSTSGYSTSTHPHVAGLMTSVKNKVLETGAWLMTTIYYDDCCRVTQRVSTNLQGGVSRVDVKYDFTGNVLQQRESHKISTNHTDVLETVNTYDERGRLLTTTVKLNGGNPATTAYTYDGVGRLASKKLGGVTETLSYNPRGWLTGKESVPFKMKLRYEAPQGGVDTCCNGNISEWEWQQGTGSVQMYGFTYDKANRLKGTIQKQKSGAAWLTLTNSYLENGITYDRNGNIKTLQRTAAGAMVDNLAYTYLGNQLTEVTESVQASLAGDIYPRGSVSTGSYVYDKNGNMINDGRKSLNFNYNVLNLLSEVKTGSTTKAKYSYLADGTKLRVHDNGGVNGFDYLGSLTYKKSSAGLQLETANFGDGVIRVAGSNSAQGEVNYFLRDHLGSVRVIVDGGGVVKERNDYYPFGARHVRGDYPQLATNRLKYNGKEEQITGDLKFLDYGWRMHDSGLGRWFTLDPFSEQYFNHSNYTYCFNLPTRYNDPDGRAVTESEGIITITGDDIYVYWNILEYVMEGKTPVDNFYEALDKAANSYQHRFLNLASVTDIKEWREFSDWMEHRFDEEFVDLIGINVGWINSYSSNQNNGVGEHLIGPAMYLLGQRIDKLKPIAALGSKRGSSIASATLSKVLPHRFTHIFGKKMGTSVARTVGTNVLGRALGRAFPATGIILTGYDLGRWHGSRGRYHYEPHDESFFKEYFEEYE